MRPTARSTAGEVAACVAETLKKAGLRAVLSGGGCASIYTAGTYQSVDLDFILQGNAPPHEVARAMAVIGFHREANQFFHEAARFYVEFPPGPLAIGSDYEVQPVEVSIRGMRLLTLSATDSCRDRLTAYFHWNDRQSLEIAVRIAARNDVNLDDIRRWSEQERALPRFERFLEDLAKARRRREKRKSVRKGLRRR